MKKKIAIIGSGIAGLTIANLFKNKTDIQIKIYEKEKILSLDEGYGIQLSHNSISILNKINFNKIDTSNFYNPSKLNFFSADSTKVSDLDLERFNTGSIKYTTIKRSILIEFLKEPLFSENMVFGKIVKKVSYLKNKLLINFSDSTNDLVDYIIVSDGVFSNTKSVIESKNKNPVYNGTIAIRSIFMPEQDFNYEKNNISLIMLKNSHIVLYPVNKKGEMNLVCIVRQKFSQKINPEILINEKVIPHNKNLKNLFSNNLKSWPTYVTKKPFKSNYKNVLYLGDAFYTFSPTMAQGASQSIEAAYELFNLIASDTKNLQKIYYTKRIERIKLINIRSKINYFIFHLSNSILVKIRNFILKKIMKSDMFLKNYLGNIYKKI